MAKKAVKSEATPQQKEKSRKYPKINEKDAANFVSLQEIVAKARSNLSRDL